MLCPSLEMIPWVSWRGNDRALEAGLPCSPGAGSFQDSERHNSPPNGCSFRCPCPLLKIPPNVPGHNYDLAAGAALCVRPLTPHPLLPCQGVCHRDLKLENTLLDGRQAPRLKICDFGYSKVRGGGFSPFTGRSAYRCRVAQPGLNASVTPSLTLQ